MTVEELPYKECHKYIDSIENLHEKFRKIAKEANYESLKVHHDSFFREKKHCFYNLNSHIENTKYNLFIDTGEKHPQDAFNAYFIFDNIIFRFLKVTLDYSFLFPIRDHSGDKDYEGLSYDEICNIFKKKNEYYILNLERDEKKDIYKFKMNCVSNTINDIIDDDFYNPYKFPDSFRELKIVDLPEDIKGCNYKIKDFVTKFAKANSHCVFFVENNSQIIKVLRWDPQKITNDIRMPHLGNSFFYLGYIDSKDAQDLYNFMLENKSQLLFGKRDHDSVTVTDNISIFFDNKYHFPKCLANIKII